MAFYAGTEIVDIAKQIESMGEAFYEEALRHIKDPKIREVFSFLHGEERRHRGVFEALLGKVGQRPDAWRRTRSTSRTCGRWRRTGCFPI